jgi:hypothetical protein
MMPDEGYRYQDTVYDDDWLRSRGHLNGALPAAPVIVDDPARPSGSWMAYDWGRRSYDDVMSPVRTVPASTVQASTVQASTVPASTVQASTVPASTVPGSPG